MANRQRGEVSIEADDKTYVMRFGANELCNLEDQFNAGVNEVLKLLSDESNVRIKTIVTFVWCGLGGASKLSFEQAGEIVTAVGIKAIMEKVGDAMKLAFPAPEPSAGE